MVGCGCVGGCGYVTGVGGGGGMCVCVFCCVLYDILVLVLMMREEERLGECECVCAYLNNDASVCAVSREESLASVPLCMCV